ncbi:hypothetical protein [Micromonospora sp. WMMD736]|uniref:hypothetical protein n=1 Tax=Micromonospora sp. WMMD736 TaxID=3404112 RepID=UPI003B96250C
MTTPASPNDHLLIDLAALSDLLPRVDRWRLTPEKWVAVKSALADLDAAYGRADANGISDALDLLIEFEDGMRVPISGLGSRRDPTARSVPQMAVPGGAEVSDLVAALRAKTDTALRTAEDRPDGREADRA